jgi:hypothetical protein
MRAGTQQLAVVGTCLLAAMTNAGSVTSFALALFVLPGVLMAAVLGSFLASRRLSATALILGSVLALGWAELVNIWSGTGDGPAARASFVAAFFTLVAVVVAQSSSPALFLVAVAGAVCGALLLGAGGEVRIVAVATAVAATLTLATIEQSRRNWTVEPRFAPALVLVSLLVGAAAAGIVVVQTQRESKQPEAIGSGLAYPGIKPPWPDPLGMTTKHLSTTAKRPSTTTKRLSTPPPPAAQPNRARPHTYTSEPRPPHPRAVAHPRHAPHPQPSVWPYILAGILLLLVAALSARLLAVRMRWRRVQRALAAGSVVEQITGAWTWTRLRLEASRLPLAPAVSPDLVAAGGAGIALRAEVFAPLQALARWTTAAAFANDQRLVGTDARAAWRAALQTEASVRESLTRLARVRLAFRGPSVKVRAH